MKNKFLSVLLAAAVAFGLWLYVITVVSPESEKTYYDIPVVLQNKEILTQRGLMIVSETPKVTLALKSDRATLNDLNEANINVITNLANVEKPGTHNLTYTITYPGNVPSGSVSVLSSSTEMITLKVENRIKKDVPIVVVPKKNSDGTDTAVPQNYITDLQKVQLTTQRDNQTVEISNVEISGPQSVVDQIHQAVIDVDLNGQTKTFSKSEIYTLCNEDGNAVNAEKVTTNVDVVDLTLAIQKMKKVELVANVIPGKGAAKENATVTLNPASIVIVGDEVLVDKVESEITIDVDLGDYLENTTAEINLKQALQGAEVLLGSETVQVKIEFTGLATKTLSVPVTVTGMPETYEVESMTQTVEVTVRGPEQDVKKLTADDLLAQVNCTDVQLGINSKQAVITCPGYPNVAVVEDTYTVSMDIREKTVERSLPDMP